MLNVGEFGPSDETWSASHRRSEVRVLNLPVTFYHSHSPSTVSYVVLVHKGSSVVQVFKCCTTPPTELPGLYLSEIRRLITRFPPSVGSRANRTPAGCDGLSNCCTQCLRLYLHISVSYFLNLKIKL